MIIRGKALCLSLVVLLTLTAATPSEASAADECQFGCGLVLGLTSFTVATGSVAAWSRVNGGISNPGQGRTMWALGFVATVGAGAAVPAASRERAVFAAGIGAAAGALAGFTLESLTGSGEGSTKVAAALIGAAAGALVGGVYGALSHESEAETLALPATRPTPLVGFRIPF